MQSRRSSRRNPPKKTRSSATQKPPAIQRRPHASRTPSASHSTPRSSQTSLAPYDTPHTSQPSQSRARIQHPTKNNRFSKSFSGNHLNDIHGNERLCKRPKRTHEQYQLPKRQELNVASKYQGHNDGKPGNGNNTYDNEDYSEGEPEDTESLTEVYSGGENSGEGSKDSHQ